MALNEEHVGNTNLKLQFVSSGAFVLAILCLLAGTLLNGEIVTFYLHRLSAWAGFLACFYSVYAYLFGNPSFSEMWEKMRTQNNKTVAREIWLFQSLILSLLVVALFVFSNPWL